VATFAVDHRTQRDSAADGTRQLSDDHGITFSQLTLGISELGLDLLSLFLFLVKMLLQQCKLLFEREAVFVRKKRCVGSWTFAPGLVLEVGLGTRMGRGGRRNRLVGTGSNALLIFGR
jgi:hypothetical protein